MSYLGIVDVTQSKTLPLDIPFTDINNIVINISLCSVSFHPYFQDKLVEYTVGLLKFIPIYMQQSGLDCLYVEGASASHPLSIAKVPLLFIFQRKQYAMW